MAKLLGRHRLVVYMPGLRHLQEAILKRASVAAQDGQTPGASHESCYTDLQIEGEGPHVPGSSLDPLAPSDPRLPLTGNVGLASNLFPKPEPELKPLYLPKLLTRDSPWDTPDERHSLVYAQLLMTQSDAEEEAAEIEKATRAFQNHPTALECIAQECSNNLGKSFLDLFPGVASDLLSNMTVLTLCQRTRNNMTSWNDAVEKERDELLAIFMTSAEKLCNLLKEAGFWADFIDPSSGQAFLGVSNPNTSLFETDERFKQLGFDIEDLGCCKCIRHSIWGTHAFVGAIFTNASPDSSIVKDIMLGKDFTT